MVGFWLGHLLVVLLRISLIGRGQLSSPLLSYDCAGV